VLLDYASAQWPTEHGWRERYVLAQSAPVERATNVPSTLMRATSSGAVRLYEGTTRVLRVAAKALWLFPVMLVPKIVLWVMGNPIGDLITVLFVLLVVAFFGIFAFTVLLFAIVGPKKSRMSRSHLAFAEPRISDVLGILGDTPVRIRGRIDAGIEQGTPVLVEQWSRGERLVRHVECRSFAVMVEGKPACVVEIAAAPILVGRYGDSDDTALEVASRLEGRTHERASASRCVLRQGDEVEIIAREAQRTPRVEDERLRALVEGTGDAGPYRAADASTLLVRCTPEQPVVIAG
jgi:hypothetical protein